MKKRIYQKDKIMLRHELIYEIIKQKNNINEISPTLWSNLYKKSCDLVRECLDIKNYIALTPYDYDEHLEVKVNGLFNVAIYDLEKDPNDTTIYIGAYDEEKQLHYIEIDV